MMVARKYFIYLLFLRFVIAFTDLICPKRSFSLLVFMLKWRVKVNFIYSCMKK